MYPAPAGEVEPPFLNRRPPVEGVVLQHLRCPVEGALPPDEFTDGVSAVEVEHDAERFLRALRHADRSRFIEAVERAAETRGSR